MIIYQANVPIKWKWLECKKGDIICLSEVRHNFFKENSNKLRFIGHIRPRNNQTPHLMDINTFHQFLRLEELQQSSSVEELRALMRRENVKPMGRVD